MSRKSGKYYNISPAPVRFNTHCPIEEYKVRIIDGVPYCGSDKFKFYTGFENKYKSKLDEVKDLVRRF